MTASRIVLVAGAAATLSACSFIEPTSLPLVAPQVTATMQVKQLTLRWPSVDNAEWYRIVAAPDGEQLTQVGDDLDGDATSVAIPIAAHRIQWMTTRYRVEACHSDACVSSADLAIEDLMLGSIGTLSAAAGDLGDGFGIVALSGDGQTLVIGAPYEDSAASGINSDQTNNSLDSAGAVYIYTRDGGTWAQQFYIKPSNPQPASYFGLGLAISNDGTVLAVGAVGESSNATGIDGAQDNTLATGSGATYVFRKTAATWTQEAYIKASNAEARDYFGEGVALSGDGNTLAVSALGEGSATNGVNGDQADNGAAAAGAVYVFRSTAGTWTQQAYVKASNSEPEDYFGASVALSDDGNTLAVGADQEASLSSSQDDNGGYGAGAVYVFARSGEAWVHQAYLKAAAPEEQDGFGRAVALSNGGDRLVIGAPGEDSNATGVTTIGDPFIIPNNNAPEAGAVYVFVRTAGVWSPDCYVKPSNPASSSGFGNSVALAGDGALFAVGAIGENGGSLGINGSQIAGPAPVGAVYTFERSDDSWAQQAYVKGPTVEDHDTMGFRISLSDDGDALAASAPMRAENTGVTFLY